MYEKLLAATAAVVGQAHRLAKDIAAGVKHSPDVMKQAALEGMKKKLETMTSEAGDPANTGASARWAQAEATGQPLRTDDGSDSPGQG